MLNFHYLGLKKLISTHYEEDIPSYKLEYDGENIVKTNLGQNGDFRSPECIEILKEADIVCTNPPFSLFREYLSLLKKHHKDFIIIGNTNAITYKEVFELFKKGKMRIGYTNFNVGMFFTVPDYYEKYTKIVDGVKYARVSTACWFTSLDTSKSREKLILHKKYNPEEHPNYENYKAIEVGRVNNIPMDYEGVMGVPITFMNKYNPKQFEIVGADFEVKNTLSYLQNPNWEGSFHRGVVNGKTKYARVLIRNKNNRGK